MSDLPLTLPAEKHEMPSHWRGEMAALLALGVPMALTQIVQFSIYTVDVVMIGRLSPEDLAAAAVGSVIYFALWMLGSGPVSAVTPLVAQVLGENKHERRDARISVRMALWVIALMVPFLFAILLFAEPLMLALRQDPVVARKAGEYVLALAPGWPFALGVMALRNFLAAIGKTFVPFLMVAASVLVNIGMNALLIFGLWGFPELGLVGAGIASSIAYFACFVFFVIYISVNKDAREFHIFENWWRPHWSRFAQVVKLGAPMSAMTVFEGMLFNACVIIVGVIGVLEQAAYQVALNVAALAYMMPWGLAMAGSARAGLAAGSGSTSAVKRVALCTMAACTVMITIFAVIVVSLPEQIAAAYVKQDTPDAVATAMIVAGFLPIAAAFMIFDAVQVSAIQVLRGLKDVLWPMVLCGISYWGIGFPVALYLGLYTDLAANGVWYGLLAGLFAASVLMGGRLYLFAWRSDPTRLARRDTVKN